MCGGRAEDTALARSEEPSLRVVFMGSDAFSVPSLEACLAQCEVVAVYTQPDRRSGRGRRRLSRSPVKEVALSLGLPVEQPEKFDKRCSERLREFEPDLTVVAAYGQLLPRHALAAARVDSINVHASLLPRHRGAAPVAAAILAGDAEAGVTVMKLRPELDAGEIIICGGGRRAQRAAAVADDETAGELAARLATLGGELLADVLPAFADGSVTYELQDDARATYAPMLRKSDGEIDWSQPAGDVLRRIRAMTPWPGACTELQTAGAAPVRVTVLRARACGSGIGGRPGQIHVRPGPQLLACTGGGWLELLEVKPAGRKAMAAAEFIRGCRPLRDTSGRDGDCWFGSA
ncbi:MAG: methionyl-tRNA formyltransferase [Planctomycetota bacterium]